MKRYIYIIIAMCTAVAGARAGDVDYAKHFSDSTLRLDYMLSGTEGNVSISLRDRSKSAGWAGRRNHLDSLHYKGNLDVTVSAADGTPLYRNSQSSLFTEWLALGLDVPEAFEHTVLVPMPSEAVTVTASIYENRQKPIATITHRVAPDDILIKETGHHPHPHTYLHKGAYDGHKITVAILPEGYTKAEMETFMADAQTAADAILDHEPFKTMADRFDFVAVEMPSEQSGVSVPRLGQWVDTPFKSHFSTFYSDRYLTSSDVFAMHDALAGIPYEHIIVLVNTPEYGGGGIYNSYTLTAAHHEKFRPVVVHEFGHSFGGLADEYFYDGEVLDGTYDLGTEPWEPNITTLVDFGSKWAGMLDPATPVPTPVAEAAKHPVGVYEGGGYRAKGVYRPADYCRMRINEIGEFCPVCRQALTDLILYYTE